MVAVPCEGIPPTLYTVELDEPLGDRQIVGTSDPERVSTVLPTITLGTVDTSIPRSSLSPHVRSRDRSL